MSRYHDHLNKLIQLPKIWLVTGAAGFIGSNLIEVLLRHNQRVIGLDNFSTGHKHNLDEVKRILTPLQWSNLYFINGDIRDITVCKKACHGVDYVLHQAALGSVPRSIDDPIATNSVNIDGFLNMLVAARDSNVKKFVYAASSSTYGDHPDLPKKEEIIGRPLSPYAVTKYVNETYASVFERCYGLKSVGLRYFNVFGPRQDPSGSYAAVIPKWTFSLLSNQPVYINGDGSTSRDFCYIDNVVQANILAALDKSDAAFSEVYNVAVGKRTKLIELFSIIKNYLVEAKRINPEVAPIYREFREGDVLHSLADINKIRSQLSYEPTHDLVDGIPKTLEWFLRADRIK